MAMRRRHHSRRHLLRLHGDLWCRNESASLGACLAWCFLYRLDGGRGDHHRNTHSKGPICTGYFSRNCRLDPLPHLVDRIDSVRIAPCKHVQIILTANYRYSVILSNRLTTTIGTQVPPALIAAGLPEGSVASFIAAFSVGVTAFEAVPGITPEILAIGTNAYQHANADAYRTVFFANMAFSGVAIICSLLLPNVDHLLTGQVATTLHQGRDEGHIAGEETK